jgi:hypothetical protein
VATEPHLKRAAVFSKKVQARLNDLSVEWLIEKFKELPPKARREFIQRAQRLEV